MFTKNSVTLIKNSNMNTIKENTDNTPSEGGSVLINADTTTTDTQQSYSDQLESQDSLLDTLRAKLEAIPNFLSSGDVDLLVADFRDHDRDDFVYDIEAHRLANVGFNLNKTNAPRLAMLYRFLSIQQKKETSYVTASVAAILSDTTEFVWVSPASAKIAGEQMTSNAKRMVNALLDTMDKREETFNKLLSDVLSKNNVNVATAKALKAYVSGEVAHYGVTPFIYLDPSSNNVLTVEEIMAMRKTRQQPQFLRGKGMPLFKLPSTPEQTLVVGKPTLSAGDFKAILQHYKIPSATTKLRLPVFEEILPGQYVATDIYSQTLVHFGNRYRQVEYDKQIWIKAAILNKGLANAVSDNALAELSDVITSTYCGNGNAVATVLRLSKVVTAAKWWTWKTYEGFFYSVNRRHEAFGIEPAQMIKNLSVKVLRWMNIGSIKKLSIKKDMGLEDLLTLMQLKNGTGKGFYPVNAGASSGLIYPAGSTQGTQRDAIFIMADRYLNMMKDYTAAEVLSAFKHLKYVPVKAKFESNVMFKDIPTHVSIAGVKYPEVKARNYYPVDTAGSTVAKCLLKYYCDDLQPSVGELNQRNPLGDQNLSMLGTKFFKGAPHIFFTNMLKNVKLEPNRIGIRWKGCYSDNVYALVGIHTKNGIMDYFVSIDGEKMESQAGIVDYVIYDYTMMRALGIGRDTNIFKYMTTLHPQLSAEMLGIISDFTVRIPGQVSGAAGTAQVNTLMSCMLMDSYWGDLVKYSKGGFAFTEEFVKHMEDRCLRFSLESVVPLLDIVKPGVYKVDFLGFSLHTLSINNYGVNTFVLVLAKDRLLKAVVNDKLGRLDNARKTDVNEDDPLRFLSKSLVRYGTLWNLYLLGGWAYPEIAMILKSRLYELRETVVDSKDLLSGYEMDFLETLIDSDAGAELMEVLGLSGGSVFHDVIPSMEMIMRLHLHPAAYKKWVLYMLKDDITDISEVWGAHPSEEALAIIEVEKPELYATLIQTVNLVILEKILRDKPAEIAESSYVFSRQNERFYPSYVDRVTGQLTDPNDNWDSAPTTSLPEAPLELTAKMVREQIEKPYEEALVSEKFQTIEKKWLPNTIKQITMKRFVDLEKKDEPKFYAAILISRLAKALAVGKTNLKKFLSATKRTWIITLQNKDKAATTTTRDILKVIKDKRLVFDPSLQKVTVLSGPEMKEDLLEDKQRRKDEAKWKREKKRMNAEQAKVKVREAVIAFEDSMDRNVDTGKYDSELEWYVGARADFIDDILVSYKNLFPPGEADLFKELLKQDISKMEKFARTASGLEPRNEEKIYKKIKINKSEPQKEISNQSEIVATPSVSSNVGLTTTLDPPPEEVGDSVKQSGISVQTLGTSPKVMASSIPQKRRVRAFANLN
jgi:hypothetical protein